MRYIFLYFKYMMINIKSILVYDLDYMLGIVAMVIKSAVNFCMLLLIFQLVDDVAGWSFEQMLFLYGMSTVSYALWHCFFIDIITIPVYIQTGEFDRFLLKPLDPLFQIMMEGFDEDGWGELIFGIGILVTAIIKLKCYSWTLVFLPAFCLCGCLIFAAISILCSSVAFFTVGNIDLTDNVIDFQEFAKYPMDIFQKGIRIVFTVIIPVAFTAYIPSKLYINAQLEVSNYWAFITIPVAILFFYAAWWVWHYSLRKYNSSGY